MTCSTLVETWSFRNQLLPIANAIKHILNLFKGLIELRGLGAAIMACSSQHAHLPKRAATEQQWLPAVLGSSCYLLIFLCQGITPLHLEKSL